MKAKWQKMMAEYGKKALIVYLTIFALTFATVFILLQAGFKEPLINFLGEWLSEETLSAGTGVMAYAVTKLSQPLRIALTVAIVPFVANKKDQSE